ncbi:alpha/beta fold hydrolase [Synechococcus sp. MU1625]|jgi:pimeloyl-ACP methyl ester carboxylesterase|uniref:alpha/beta fold hydrolase n=1 Tax=Synechococcus sp. MU1625 TaxID=2508347 RepID=UPI001CF8F6EB|nr:alpha/beta fold hydrolase [Synechococcus sp. MU1625]MCB4400648.1 alpha/beta fold hydrolase [Synechococcus sp. MU1625]
MTYQPQTWTWNQFNTSFIHCPSVDNRSRAIILIHGFGACKEHWRGNIEILSQHGDVYAMDLVGFGESAKPTSHLKDEAPSNGSFCYGIEAWAQQVTDFINQKINAEKIILAGNSIGGVVACQTAKNLEDQGRQVERLILIDCAQREIDDKRLSEQPPFRRLSKPLLKKLVRQRWLTKGLYTTLAKKGIIKKVLELAYPTKQNVDDELINVLYRATQDKNADEAFRGFINLFDDLLAPDIMKELSTPVHLIWGEKDPWEPLAIAKTWTSIDCVKSIKVLPDLGHCPHDESPQMVNSEIATLLQA